MKKKIIICLFCFLIIITILRFLPYGTKEIKMPNSSINLEVPRFSLFKEECCMFSASFKSYRSTFALEKEIEKILNKYEKIICHSKTYYYDKDNNITITDYGVKIGFILNEFYLTYDKGKYDNNECSIVTDAKKMSYSFKDCPTDGCYGTYEFEYKDEENNIHKLYYLIKDKYLLFETGMGQKNYLTSMLEYGWISMKDVINYLDYQVELEKATGEIYRDGGSILYKTNDLALLKCNTLDGNKDIYLGDKDLRYEENYCK